MKTLTEKYNAVLEGKFNKKQFVRDARLAHPQLITQYNGYDDTVAILKNRGYIFEELQKYKEEKISDHQYESSTEDMFSLEDIERGVDYELEKKGFNTVHRDFTEDDYEKAKTTVIKNLEKNRNHYLSLLGGESTKVQKNRKDVMKPAEKGEAVDKANGMIKADLKENKKGKDLGSILEPHLDKVQDGARFIDAKQAIIDVIANSRINQDSKDQMLKDVERLKNLPALQRYVYNAYLAKAGLRSPDSKRGRRYNESVTEGRRAKSKGGKVVKEDDYGNGGYVEMMSADLNRGINLIQKAWDDWKAGPLTEPAMIEYAKEDLIRYISNELTFFDEQDAIAEEEIEALQEKKTQLKEGVLGDLGYYEDEKGNKIVTDLIKNEKYIESKLKGRKYKKEYDQDVHGHKIVVFTIPHTDKDDTVRAQLKESFKKLIFKVLTEDKKKVNEEVEEINGHKVQHVQTVQDQDENFGESYVVFLIDNQFLVVFAVVVGKDVPGANHKEGDLEIAAKYWFPGEMVIGMKDGLEKYAKGPTSRAKMTVKRIFRELAQDADYHMGTSIPGDIKLDPEDYEYGSLDTIFEVTTEEKETEQKAFTLDGKVL